MPFYFFLQWSQKNPQTTNNNKTPPTPANTAGSSHYCSSSSIAAQVLCSTQFRWLMRNDGMWHSGSIWRWILSTQAKVIWALKKRRCPWKAQAGPAALVGVSRETRSARQALPENSAAVVVAEPLWNVFMLQERQAYNFLELLAHFQEEVVLCVNCFWSQYAVIAAITRMGGKEIPLTLQSPALRFFF